LLDEDFLVAFVGVLDDFLARAVVVAVTSLESNFSVSHFQNSACFWSSCCS
jgi:hypothetical protein